MILSEIGAYLAANGIGTVGTDIFLGILPDVPDSCCGLFEAGGMAPYRAFRSAPGQPVAERPRLQVICRDNEFDYSDARTKAGSINALLEGLGDVTLSGCRYLWIGAVAPPSLMGRDDSGRVQIVQNFDVVKELS